MWRQWVSSLAKNKNVYDVVIFALTSNMFQNFLISMTFFLNSYELQ